MKTKLALVLFAIASLGLVGCANFQQKVSAGINQATIDINKVAADVVTVGQTAVAVGGDVVNVGTGLVKSAGAVVIATAQTVTPGPLQGNVTVVVLPTPATK
jgi:starvation-inducible outer membrane lipoprotein